MRLGNRSRHRRLVAGNEAFRIELGARGSRTDTSQRSYECAQYTSVAAKQPRVLAAHLCNKMVNEKYELVDAGNCVKDERV